ncbi:MAG: EAL domain-containing protein [Chloroflexota bacterium]
MKRSEGEVSRESEAKYRGLLEAASDAMVVVNQSGDIVLLNLQAEKQFGYKRDELLGQPVTNIIPEGFAERLIADDLRSAAEALTQRIGTGIELSARRKDGTRFPIEIMLSPLENDDGILVTAAIRDISVRKDAEQRLVQLVGRSAQLARQRALIAEALRGLRAGDSPQATAQVICRQVLNLSEVAAAQILLFESGSEAVTIGLAIAGRPDPPLRRIPAPRSKQLRARAAQGPWIESWAAGPEHRSFREFSPLGRHLVACAPLRSEQGLIGLLVMDAMPSVDEVQFTESLAALVEFADLASALIGRDVADRSRVRRARDRIHRIIDDRAFRPVFQPIVNVAQGRTVGYEALTRFSGGEGPQIVFGQAASVGLGPELEAATMAAAVAAAKELPRSAWLSLNVSPELVVAYQPLQTLVKGMRRRVVLEVTEQMEIADYAAFRAALEDLGPKTMLAVDDAGAGFASFRHILELHPTQIKLDRSLITDLESDQARQAMIAGLRHFARLVQARIIAEGVETPGELAALRTLGIRLAQGFLLGRPMPAAHYASSRPAA